MRCCTSLSLNAFSGASGGVLELAERETKCRGIALRLDLQHSLQTAQGRRQGAEIRRDESRTDRRSAGGDGFLQALGQSEHGIEIRGFLRAPRDGAHARVSFFGRGFDPGQSLRLSRLPIAFQRLDRVHEGAVFDRQAVAGDGAAQIGGPHGHCGTQGPAETVRDGFGDALGRGFGVDRDAQCLRFGGETLIDLADLGEDLLERWFGRRGRCSGILRAGGRGHGKPASDQSAQHRGISQIHGV
jgi:hypothetical protein